MEGARWDVIHRLVGALRGVEAADRLVRLTRLPFDPCSTPFVLDCQVEHGGRDERTVDQKFGEAFASRHGRATLWLQGRASLLRRAGSQVM